MTHDKLIFNLFGGGDFLDAFVSVILFAHVEIFSVARIQDLEMIKGTLFSQHAMSK